MALTFTIDQKALAIILDGSLRQAIGTGFAFIQPNWVMIPSNYRLKLMSQNRRYFNRSLSWLNTA